MVKCIKLATEASYYHNTHLAHLVRKKFNGGDKNFKSLFFGISH